MRAEVAVVGAGIIGALAAYELRKRGLEVLLLDAGKEGAATPASAGMLAPYPEGLSGEVLEAALFGLERYPDLLAELGDWGLPLEADFSGTQVVALSPGEEEAWEAREPLAYPVRGGRGARTFPGGYVHPRALRQALLKALEAMETPLVPAEVDRVQPGRIHGRGEGGRFSLEARRILLAVGAWGGRFGLGVRPLKGEALLLEGAPPPMPLFAGDGYLLPREGGVYVGATGREGWAPGVDLFGLRWLADYAHERFPPLEGARFREALWGYRPVGELFVGEVEEGIYAAVGHGRNGVLLAPWTAARVLELMGVGA
ncbi:NAD(P)/FAD-dependent oxidoreductase [Thermus thermamylovorans]|uniref:FAD-dependent oxidoreductase n=1 Tax=Thermus thermamylovorans TaxID=2509362 RepID=A0A4Q9B0N2_9DEIN|nr:FAD-dependent oxidoreductase [Thermus thermamylovorans]TBH17612.1 FAD-dependent oxidoreductase [Thermus thermamylovorans]